MTTDPVF